MGREGGGGESGDRGEREGRERGEINKDRAVSLRLEGKLNIYKND